MDRICPNCQGTNTHAVVIDADVPMPDHSEQEVTQIIDAGCWCDDCNHRWQLLEVTKTPFHVYYGTVPEDDYPDEPTGWCPGCGWELYPGEDCPCSTGGEIE